MSPSEPPETQSESSPEARGEAQPSPVSQGGQSSFIHSKILYLCNFVGIHIFTELNDKNHTIIIAIKRPRDQATFIETQPNQR